jgi:hypothetical protein
MKKKYWVSFFLISALSFVCFITKGQSNIIPGSQNRMEANEYTVVIEGFDWGPAVTKVILHTSEAVSSAETDDFTIFVERKSDCGEVTNSASGERSIVYAYVSNEQGNIVDEGKNITLVMTVAPNLRLPHPYQSFRNETCNGTYWLDYNMTITNKTSGKIWNKEANRIMPLVDDFDLSGKFTHGDITMSYASFAPETKNEKSPSSLAARWR